MKNKTEQKGQVSEGFWVGEHMEVLGGWHMGKGMHLFHLDVDLYLSLYPFIIEWYAVSKLLS